VDDVDSCDFERTFGPPFTRSATRSCTKCSGEERECQALIATMEGLNKIRAASRPNCELIASCPITLSHSSSISYDEGCLGGKMLEGLPRNGSLRRKSFARLEDFDVALAHAPHVKVCPEQFPLRRGGQAEKGLSSCPTVPPANNRNCFLPR